MGCEAERHVFLFAVLAVELHLQQVLPGDHIRVALNCGDLIPENEVFSIFLQSKADLCRDITLPTAGTSAR